MADEKILTRYKGLYESFDRKGGTAVTATHYCPGCGHGILHKLIGEALADLDIQDRTIMISPVGCAVFGYYYFDCGNMQAAHGRAPAVGTGIARSLKHAVVISYQGDGDLGAIGFNETFQAANRGERMVVMFVNNAIYGMTGGQMAPTTLPGQRTTTSPEGRSLADTGYPIHVCELFSTLQAPVYIERCSLADAKRVRKARQAVRKALRLQKERKGFALVELLSPCPTCMHATSQGACRFVIDEMEPEFPLGCFRDTSAEAVAAEIVKPRFDVTALQAAFSDYGVTGAAPALDPDFAKKQIKVAGFGGQGVLSLGLMLAQAGAIARRHVTWMPDYGPEQRGGTANCSVVVSGESIGSPVFSDPDVLVAMNYPSLKRFGPTVTRTGVIFHEQAAGDYKSPTGARCIAVPAREIAEGAGTAKAANTAMLAVLATTGATALPLSAFPEALERALLSKPKLIARNREIFAAAVQWAQEHLPPASA